MSSSTPWWWSPWPTRPEFADQAAQLAALKERIDMVAAEHQAQIDALTARLEATAAGLRADVDALKAAAEAGEVLDFTPLDNRVGLLEGLDAENPESTPVVPPEEPAPVPEPTPEPGV